jgi:hypothetical protein
MSQIQQTRISLKRLKVSNFASRETLAFEATVLWDGLPIAQARNEGHGGITILDALKCADGRLDEARAFAKALPPLVTDDIKAGESAHKVELPMSLDFLIVLLASEAHEERCLQAAFRRDLSTKLLYVADDRLLYVKGMNRKRCSTQELHYMYVQIRKQYGPETKILAMLSNEEAFALWKKYMLKEGRRT